MGNHKDLCKVMETYWDCFVGIMAWEKNGDIMEIYIVVIEL